MADLLANLIEKYALKLDIEDMPDPRKNGVSEEDDNLSKPYIENVKAA